MKMELSFTVIPAPEPESIATTQMDSGSSPE